jgi:hypothetical protein
VNITGPRFHSRKASEYQSNAWEAGTDRGWRIGRGGWSIGSNTRSLGFDACQPVRERGRTSGAGDR